MMIKRIFKVVDDWLQDPVGFVTICLFLLLVATLYLAALDLSRR